MIYLCKRRHDRAGQQNAEDHQGTNQTLAKLAVQPNLATYQYIERENIENIYFTWEKFNSGHQRNAISRNPSQYTNTETNNPASYSYVTLEDLHAYDLQN